MESTRAATRGRADGRTERDTRPYVSRGEIILRGIIMLKLSQARAMQRLRFFETISIISKNGVFPRETPAGGGSFSTILDYIRALLPCENLSRKVPPRFQTRGLARTMTRRLGATLRPPTRTAERVSVRSHFDPRGGNYFAANRISRVGRAGCTASRSILVHEIISEHLETFEFLTRFESLPFPSMSPVCFAKRKEKRKIHSRCTRARCNYANIARSLIRPAKLIKRVATHGSIINEVRVHCLLMVNILILAQ